MHKLLIGILTTWLCFTYAFSQRARPDWIDHPPTSPPNYLYYFEKGSSLESDAKARREAINKVLERIAYKRGFHFSYTSQQKTTQKEKNKTFEFENIYVEAIDKKSEVDFLEGLTIEDEYAEVVFPGQQKRFDHYVWMKIPVIKKWKAVARSALIPGLGQAYKGQKLKGGILFAVCAGSVVTGFVADSRSASAINQAHLTRDTALIRMYTTQSDNWEDLRNGAFALAVASYIYNLVDVSAGKGSRMFAYSAPGRIQFQPLVASNSVGLSCTFMIK